MENITVVLYVIKKLSVILFKDLFIKDNTPAKLITRFDKDKNVPKTGKNFDLIVFQSTRNDTECLE